MATTTRVAAGAIGRSRLFKVVIVIGFAVLRRRLHGI
jgi:hypothetical protein